MDTEVIAQVRRFNRLVTRRVGALDQRFLARDRPMGESRVLWEVGEEGCDLRTLRSRLGLDSGYLSRVVRSLAEAGLVVVEEGADDRRVRVARLTEAGRAERAILDRRSDELATDMVAGLDDAQRDRLVAAMADVERLLTAALVRVEVVAPDDERAVHCVREYVAELGRRFPQGFDVGSAAPAPLDLCVVAELQEEPVGVGGLIVRGDGAQGVGEVTRIGEVKRMWVSPAARGLGLGRRLLAALEAEAAARGCTTVRLDTNEVLTEAIRLYETSGYRPVPRFNDDPYPTHFFEKPL